MNIFVLDNDPFLAAQYHCDKHVVKMIVESFQILSFAHHHYNTKYKDVVYKKTHANHPCCQWVIQSYDNYKWLYQLAFFLLKEYTYRYNKIHKSQEKLQYIYYNPCPEGALTPFAQAMPEQYRDENTVQAYRNYYIGEKIRFAKWRLGNIPKWFVLEM